MQNESSVDENCWVMIDELFQKSASLTGRRCGQDAVEFTNILETLGGTMKTSVCGWKPPYPPAGKGVLLRSTGRGRGKGGGGQLQIVPECIMGT